jgi:diguanylate cyclase (GGDEF)-like protein
MLNGVVLSLLIVFLNIQNQSLYTDFLTEVNNRKKLEMYMKEKISASTEDKTFSAILIDMDNFKYINDTFGHNVGDTALQIFAKLLNSCLRPNDFISRFGGDEFCIVLDISDITGLNEIINRINKRIIEYNESGVQPYKLGFSIGYAVYDYHSHMNVNDFQKQVDMLMYENKQNNRVKHEPEDVI